MKFIINRITFLFLLFLLYSCAIDDKTNVVNWTNKTVIENYSSGIFIKTYDYKYTNLKILLYLNSNYKNVYFILTNIEDSQSATGEISGPINSLIDSASNKNFQNPDQNISNIMTLPAQNAKNIYQILDLKKIDNESAKSDFLNNIQEFNSNAYKKFKNNNIFTTISNNIQKNIFSNPPAINKDSVNDTNDFITNEYNTTVTSTCQKVVENIETKNGNRTLNIYVANDQWGTGNGAEITSAEIDQIADRFLTTGLDNDIYDWITNIYGKEWGSHNYTNLIGETDQITILIYDIPENGVIGYYWSKDNFTDLSYSNKRLIFYIDSYFLKQSPQIAYSTLAHEFQHMIHFYQKDVSTTRSSTWFNEMCSMVAEDFVSDKIQVDGPRGVQYTDYTAGTPNNTNGRLPYFNSSNYESLTIWLGGYNVLKSYGINYSYGAFLARNFGGATFFNSLFSGNSYSGINAINYSLSKLGYSKKFQDTLVNWGIATVLSDKKTGLYDGIKYNINGAFVSNLNGIEYKLGSINLYNYNFGGQKGPFFYSIQNVPSTLKPYSNTYIWAGAFTGTQSWDFKMSGKYRLTMIIRD